MRIIAVAAIALTLWGCSKQNTQATTDSTATVAITSDADAITRVASDKELLRQALVESANRGTLTEAASEAAQDSVVAAKLRSALMGPARVSSASTSKHSTSKSSSAAEKQDALDKANQSLDKANQTVDKSGQVLNKAHDIGRKAGDILNGRR